MKIPVKAVCSECMVTNFTKLSYDQKELECPACGHKLPNFPESELSEMEVTVKKQRLNGIIALVCFVVALVGFGYWFMNGWSPNPEVSAWVSGHSLSEDAQSNETASMIVMFIGFLGTLIFAILSSTKRYVIEF